MGRKFSNTSRNFFPILSVLVFGVIAVIITSVYVSRNRMLIGSRAASASPTTYTQLVADTAVPSGSITYYYGATNIPNSINSTQFNINTYGSGVYTVQAKYLASGTEPDRYEIQIPGTVRHVFGTGMQLATNQSELGDFLDTSFSFGHCETAAGTAGQVSFDLNGWLSGGCRMRTPILVMPELNLLIAYLQPAVKMVRLTRNGSYGCPSGKTCVIMKLKAGDNTAGVAPLVIIKKSNLDAVYQAYRDVRYNLGYTDKMPAFSVFGSNWESFGELACNTTPTTVQNAVTHFLSYGRLGTVTVGSGYWNGPSPGCGSNVYSSPTTDSLRLNTDPNKNWTNINAFYSFLSGNGIVPVLGMRHRVSPQNGSIAGQFSGISPIYTTNPPQLFSTSDNNDNGFYMLNNSSAAIDRWLSLISSAYGISSGKGIKHDDMVIHDTKAYKNNPAAVNLRDDYYNFVLDRYLANYGNQFVILTRNTWIANKGDAIVPDTLGIGYTAQLTPPNWPTIQNLHRNKFQFDNAITTAMSGYPTVQNAADFSMINRDANGYPVSFTDDLYFLREMQLSTFQGVTMFSIGFWHDPDTAKQAALKYYFQLRNRLQQYAYDQAMNSYSTGTLMSLRPLFFDYPSDPNVYNLYTQLSSGNDINDPRNEFMFGNALLIRPVFYNAGLNTGVRVYLPQGYWKPFLKVDQAYTGGTYTYVLGNYNSGYLDYPVYLKEKQILILNDALNPNSLMAYVYFNSPGSTAVYTIHSRDGNRAYSLQATKSPSGTATLTNLNNGQSISLNPDPYGKNFSIGTLTSGVFPN